MELVGLIPLLNAALGLAVATYILFTAPAARGRRLIALVGVAVAALAGAAIVITGVVKLFYGLTVAWLLPVLTSIVFRQAWMRGKA